MGRLGLRVLAAASLLAACQRTAAPVASADAAPGSPPTALLIGLVGSLTGPEAHFGLGTRDGVTLAIEEANRAGGVAGHPLVLRAYDAQSKPEEAATAAMRL